MDEDDLSVLAVSPVGEAGGAEVLLIDILVGFQAAGVDVTLMVLGHGPLARLARSRHLATKIGPALSFRRPDSVLRCVQSIRKVVLDIQPTVVHASHPKGQLIVQLACPGGTPVLTTQLYDPPTSPGMSTRLAARLPGLRFAITKETAHSYTERNPALRPIVIPPGRDLSALSSQAGSGDPDAAWTRAGLGRLGPRIVMVGRLQRFKGPLDFVAMASLVLREVPDAQFLIVGPDSPLEPCLRAEVQAEIDRLGLGDVAALAGRLSSSDLAATVAGATLLVHPASREPFGLVLVEALALGTPVIAYATTGPSTILADGGGALTPPGDVAALARAVADALQDSALRSGWEEHARGIASRFELTSTVHRYLEIMRGAAAGAPVCLSRPPSTKPRVTTVGLVPPGPSGVHDYGRLLAGELRKRGHKMGEAWIENDGARLGPALLASLRLLRLAVRLRVGSAIVLHYSPFSYGYRGLPAPSVFFGAIARSRGCRLVVVLHELAYAYRPETDGLRKRITAVLQRGALGIVLWGADCAVVATEQRRRLIQETRCRRSCPIHVLPVFSTVTVTGTPRPTGRCDDLLFTLGIPGYAGDGVRPDIFFEALTLLEPLGHFRVLLIGAPGEDSPDGRMWRRLADRAGLGERVSFTGVVDVRELSAHLSACDVVVLVNEEGPSGRKTTLASALAHGRPIISLDGANRWKELIESAAVIVVPSAPEPLAVALHGLRASPSRRTELGARARAYYDGTMSLGRVADGFEALIGPSQPAASSPSHSDRTERRSSQPSTSQGRGATR